MKFFSTFFAGLPCFHRQFAFNIYKWYGADVPGENQDSISTGSEFSDTARLVDDESDDGLDNAEGISIDENEVGDCSL